MRVIAGEARRLLLKTPPGFDTRPTQDKIKETLFNILQPDIPGSYFLDLYSGSGSIGIEALSRGSSFCAFAENFPAAVRCIEENLEHTRLKEKALVLSKNVLSAIRELALKKYEFDLVYMDPPYHSGDQSEVLKILAESKILRKDALVILEADRRFDTGFLEESAYVLEREKLYKTNKHLFLKLKETD